MYVYQIRWKHGWFWRTWLVTQFFTIIFGQKFRWKFICQNYNMLGKKFLFKQFARIQPNANLYWFHYVQYCVDVNCPIQINTVFVRLSRFHDNLFTQFKTHLCHQAANKVRGQKVSFYFLFKSGVKTVKCYFTATLNASWETEIKRRRGVGLLLNQ